MFQNKNISIAKKNLASDGYCLIQGFFKKNNFYNRLIADINLVLAKLTKEKKKTKNINFYDKLICKKYQKNNDISAYLNDYLNVLPSLSSFFSNDKVVHFASKVLGGRKSDVVVNNQRLRVQIPGRDLISNLPWHQDSHYNRFSNKGRSVALWVSLGNIDNEMGPVVIKKKSHNLGTLEEHVFKKAKGVTVSTVQLNKNKDIFKEKFYPTSGGDLMLFDMDLIHRSGENKSLNKIKWSAQARYHILEEFKK